MQIRHNPLSGGYCGEVPPLPIPNREVKLTCADGTAMQCGRVGSRLLLSRASDFERFLRLFCVHADCFGVTIALFYGGLVRQKNILSILMQTVFIVAVVSLIWVAFGYSWAFSTEYADSGNPLACVIGGFDKCFLHGIGLDAIMPTGIPELTFAMFQCMFALITPALILGAFAERVKFSGYVLFTILWVIIAYLPMAHWVWGGGFLQVDLP